MQIGYCSKQKPITPSKEVVKDIQCYKTDIKRPLNDEDTIKFHHIRKIKHLNQNELDNEQTINPWKGLNNQCIQIPKQIQNQQIQVKGRNEISEKPLREKYGHLLPIYQKAQYTIEQRTLMHIQNKLDEHLLFLKGNRGHKKGSFFKKIRRNLINGSNLYIELSQIKQILYIDPQLYRCSRSKDNENCYDILIDIPFSLNEIVRREKFRKKLYEFLIKNEGFTKNKQLIIPQYKFQFEQKIEIQQKLTIPNNNYINQILQPKIQKNLSNDFLLYHKDGNFKQKLYQMIKQKEIKYKKQSQEILKYKKQINWNNNQLLKVLQQIHLLYITRQVNNMFISSMIQFIDKKILIQNEELKYLIKKLIQKYPLYFKEIIHKKGIILQINKNQYTNCRNDLMDSKNVTQIF